MEYVLMMVFIIFFIFLKFLFVFVDVVLIVNIRLIFGIDGRNRFVEKIGLMI